MAAQEPKVEADVLPDNGTVSHEIGQAACHVREAGGPLHLPGRYAGEMLDEFGDGPAGIDEGLEGV